MQSVSPPPTSGKPTLSADIDGSPLPCASWQKDVENLLPYLTRSLNFRLMRKGFLPEQREERTQEAIVQIAVYVARQYELHGGRLTTRDHLVKDAMWWGYLGRRATRSQCIHADLMDRHHSDRRESGDLLPETVIGREDVSPDARMDILTWIDGLTPKMREYATLAYHGASDKEIREKMGIGHWRQAQIRSELKKLWYKRSI